MFFALALILFSLLSFLFLISIFVTHTTQPKNGYDEYFTLVSFVFFSSSFFSSFWMRSLFQNNTMSGTGTWDPYGINFSRFLFYLEILDSTHGFHYRVCRLLGNWSGFMRYNMNAFWIPLFWQISNLWDGLTSINEEGRVNYNKIRSIEVEE